MLLALHSINSVTFIHLHYSTHFPLTETFQQCRQYSKIDGLTQEKAQEDVSKHLVTITTLLFGSDSEQQSDIALAQLSQEMYNSGLLLLLLKNMHKIDFEVKTSWKKTHYWALVVSTQTSNVFSPQGSIVF